MVPYNGRIENSDMFYIRFRDHMSNTNRHDVALLDLVESTKEVITTAKLETACVQPIPGVKIYWAWINQHLWTSMAYVVDDTVLSRRLICT